MSAAAPPKVEYGYGLGYSSRMALDWTLTSSIFCMVALRLWVGFQKQRRNTLQMTGDAFITLSLVLFLIAISTIAFKNHSFLKDPASILSREFLIIGFVQGLFYVWGVWLAKSTFLVLYFSMLRHIGPGVQKILKGTLVFLLITIAVNTLLEFLWCHPFSRNFNAAKFCSPEFSVTPQAIFTATNLATDLLMTALGIVIVSRLQMTRRQAYAILFIVAVGFIPCIATALRFSRIFTAGRSRSLTHEDLAVLEIWTLVDWIFAMHAACLPSLRVLLRRALAKETGTLGSWSFTSVVFRRRRPGAGHSQLSGSNPHHSAPAKAHPASSIRTDPIEDETELLDVRGGGDFRSPHSMV